MSQGVFLLALTIAATTVISVAVVFAKAIGGRGTSRADLTLIKDDLDRHESTLADHARQVAELQERVDFTERLLAQARERRALEAGDHSGTRASGPGRSQ